MSAKIVSEEAAQIATPRQWIRLVVAYLLIPLILLAHVGGTATSRIVGRTTKY
jgi:hypothetical protein